MKKILAFSFLIFFILPGILTAADNPEELYSKGNSSYENEDYEKAISNYEKLLETDKVSPEVFYNLGNSYFKLKKIGKAILNYERALRMDPSDRDIRFNLKLARSMAVDKINTAERGFAQSAVLFLYDRMALDELTLAVSFFYLAIILLLIFSIFFVAKRKIIFYTAGSLTAVLFVFSIFLSAKFRDENFVKTGIIPPEFKKYLIRGMETRNIGDYRVKEKVSEEQSAKQIEHAERFIEIAEKLIGPIP